MTFSGKDIVQIAALSSDSAAAQELGVYDFSEKKDAGFPFVQALTELLSGQGVAMETLTGIIVQWGAESRFTVSRLTGVTLNVLAMTHQLPVIAQKPDESLESARQRLHHNSTTAIPIEYSSEPRLG